MSRRMNPERFRVGVLCENFNNSLSGVDTALYSLVSELTEYCEITVFAASLDLACRIPGVRFRRIAASPHSPGSGCSR